MPLAAYRSQGVNPAEREILLVDGRADAGLRRIRHEATRAVARRGLQGAPPGEAERAHASALARFVAEYFGSEFSRPAAAVEAVLLERRKAQGSDVVLLGSLQGLGLSRHRAILLKYLCDRIPVPATGRPCPCRLVRGRIRPPPPSESGAGDGEHGDADGNGADGASLRSGGRAGSSGVLLSASRSSLRGPWAGPWTPQPEHSLADGNGNGDAGAGPPGSAAAGRGHRGRGAPEWASGGSIKGSLEGAGGRSNGAASVQHSAATEGAAGSSAGDLQGEGTSEYLTDRSITFGGSPPPVSEDGGGVGTTPGRGRSRVTPLPPPRHVPPGREAFRHTWNVFHLPWDDPSEGGGAGGAGAGGAGGRVEVVCDTTCAVDDVLLMCPAASDKAEVYWRKLSSGIFGTPGAALDAPGAEPDRKSVV